MKIAIIGGTGRMGGGVAKHLSKTNEVVIGSREPEKAKKAASAIPGAKGTDYQTAAVECDVAIIAVPFRAIDSISGLADALAGKLVISIVNPMKLEGGMLQYGLESGSGAEKIASLLPKSKIATAFNNVTVAFFEKEVPPQLDVLVAADSKEVFDQASLVVRSIPGLRPLYAGPLSEAQAIERITPLELNVAKINGTGSLAPRFVSQKE